MNQQREGIMAQFAGRAGAAPRARFTRNGEPLWEFTVRVADNWDPAGRTETVTVRAPDQNYASLQKWVRPGTRLLIRGWLTLVRWRAEGKDMARMVIDCVELTPLDVKIPGSAPGAMDYRGRVTAPAPLMTQAAAVADAHKNARAAQARRLLDDAEDE